MRDDRIGRAFADLLAEQARQGIRVHVLCDWLGCFGKTPASFWKRLCDSGVDVRIFNRPSWSRPFAWLNRDHRKLLVVDGLQAFVSGLCVGEDWVGNNADRTAPWRDTGVQILGPAVREISRAFSQMWQLAGPALPDNEIESGYDDPEVAGECSVCVVDGSPRTAQLFRIDLLWASIAEHELYLTDAYFAGTPPYIDGLCSAARDGVDVRLLVPSASDIRAIAAYSRTQYRPLLEAGVRIFEWNGPMMHAKTAVVDGRWARIGSSNLNIASWLGNWELDVCIESDLLANSLRDAFMLDLASSTEILLGSGRRPQEHSRQAALPGPQSPTTRPSDSLRCESQSGESHRELEPTEAKSYAQFGIVLLFIATVGFIAPRILSIPIAVLAGIGGLTFFARAIILSRGRPVDQDGDQ